MRQHSFQWRKALESQPCASRESILRIQKRYRHNSFHISVTRSPFSKPMDPEPQLCNAQQTPQPGPRSTSPLRFFLKNHSAIYNLPPRLQTKRRAPLFWLEGRALAHAPEGLRRPTQTHVKTTPQIV